MGKADRNHHPIELLIAMNRFGKNAYPEANWSKDALEKVTSGELQVDYWKPPAPKNDRSKEQLLVLF
jgi:hypothetical protein